MPVAHIQSAESKLTQKASYKRRRNQNSEINQLESLLPWSQRGASIDKISVLRLTSAYLRFKNFWQSAYGSPGQTKEVAGFSRLFSEALEGFILILSSDGEIVFVSEGIVDIIGLMQQDVIGLSIYELSHEDDVAAIKESLKPDGSLQLQQSRHFYMRFKTSVAPVKKQLSKFGGTVMLQVSGKLRLSHNRKGGGAEGESHVTGLVAECRRIESSSSILELKVSQTVFTSTTTMDLKILSIDTKMETVTGFGADIEGSILTNFFHPSDNRRSIHCLKTLLITGQACSPIIRFMTHTGEWVWVQIEGLIRYEPDNRTPKYLEATFKVVCSSDKSVKMIEQTELYGKCDDSSGQGGIHADTRFNIPTQPKVKGAEAIVKSIEETQVSDAVRDVLLHGRETALSSVPSNLERLATWPEVVDAVVEYETSKGLAPNYNPPYPEPGTTISLIDTAESSSSYSPNPSPLSDITPSESSAASPSTSNEESSQIVDVNTLLGLDDNVLLTIAGSIFTPSSAPPTTGVSPTPPAGAYSPSSVPPTGVYSPSTAPSTGAYSPSSVPPTGVYSPSTVPPTGAYSPSTAPSIGAYSPSSVPPTGVYSPFTVPPTGVYSPSSVPLTGVYSPSTVPPTGVYSPSSVPFTGAYSPAMVGVHSPSSVLSSAYSPSPSMTGAYSPSSLPINNGAPISSQLPLPLNNGVPPPQGYTTPLNFNGILYQPEPPSLSHIPYTANVYTTKQPLPNRSYGIFNGSFEVTGPPGTYPPFLNNGRQSSDGSCLVPPDGM